MSEETNRVNQKPKTEEGETIQWPKDNKTNDTNRVNQKPKTEKEEPIQWPKDNKTNNELLQNTKQKTKRLSNTNPGGLSVPAPLV